jgi:hypothetical protein
MLKVYGMADLQLMRREIQVSKSSDWNGVEKIDWNANGLNNVDSFKEQLPTFRKIVTLKAFQELLNQVRDPSAN